jgi:hypothetical protein
MSATLWLDSKAEKTIELGGTLSLYEAFAGMAKVAGASYLTDWPALFGVPSAVEDQEDVDPTWLADVQEEAARFLTKFPDVNDNAREILEQLAGDKEGVVSP